MAKKPRKGMTEERRHRAARALELRRDFVPYREIAAQLGVSLRTAYDDVQKALEEITREPAEDVLKMELERLGSMHFRLTSEIARVTRHLKQGGDVDLKAVDQVRKLIDSQVRISERRAKLLGLDVIKHDVSDDLMNALATGFEVLDDTPLDELDPDGEF